MEKNTIFFSTDGKKCVLLQSVSRPILPCGDRHKKVDNKKLYTLIINKQQYEHSCKSEVHPG